MYIDSANISGRRAFLKKGLTLVSIPALASFIQSCHSKPGTGIRGGMAGGDYKTGHLLRTPEKIPAPTRFIDTTILIAGGGISGLSAQRWLYANGQNPMMIELSDAIGGNSVYGRNSISAYPWAAHYLPVPDPGNIELIDFLHSANIVTGFNSSNLPVYNEYHICHDPEERLYINGYWQEGIVPQFGIGNEDREQIRRFFSYVEMLKHAKGEDGKYHFAIPVDNSSASEQYKELDKISFADFLKQEGYTSSYLLWYLEYCCKDDYGSLPQHTSAWAGLHYFASRRGRGANTTSSDVLTWPEGNGHLMQALRGQCGENIHPGMMIYRVSTTDNKVETYCYDVHNKRSVCIRTDKLILSTPQYVNKRIVAAQPENARDIYDEVTYAPWIVANISLSKLPVNRGAPLSWDNVIYGQHSVGYVFANHQDLNLPGKGVLTYYLPVTSADASTARLQVYEKDYSYWKKLIVNELEYAHPGITQSISQIDVRVWGHGMIRPSINYIWGNARRQAKQSINNKIFFAHSDLSGISIFEEAFYQGIRAAKEVLNSI